MIRIVVCILTAIAFTLPSIPFSQATTEQKELLPVLTLTVPEDDFHRRYLGLENALGPTFTLTQIKADIVLIELFSMYCPYCQKEAPLVNSLFEKMQERAKRGVVVKIIGLGASNSQFEVDHYRDTFNVPFPLFPDQDMSMYKKLSGAGTPGFVGCLLNKDRPPVIILRNAGGFYSAEDFLEELIKKGGLK